LSWQLPQQYCDHGRHKMPLWCGSEPSQGFVFFYLITKDRMISTANIVAARIAVRFKSE